MDFLFHSVYHDGHHSKYYNIYRVTENKFFAECHHFNRGANCEANFELIKEGDTWRANNEGFEHEATYIGEEIDRVQR